MKFKNSKLWIRIGALLISLVICLTSVFPSQATKTVDEMESELTKLNKELDEILSQIEKTTKNLEKTKEELAIAKGQEEAQYESMMLRIKYMYENGNNSLLEILLSSSCLAEFINRAEYVSKITEYDRDLLKQFAATREEIAEKEAQLLKDQEYLRMLQDELADKIANTSSELTEYKAKLKKAQEEAKRAEEYAKEEVDPIAPEKENPKNDSDKDSSDSSYKPSISVTASDVELLAALLECEAGSTNYEALLAVGSVVVNRMKNRYYPNTVYGVIYQRGQFPPAQNGKVDRILARGVKPLCLTAARDALNGKNNVGDCLSFRSASSGLPGLVIGGNVFF